MNELIKIEQRKIGNEELNSVNARDLWKALDIKKDFSNWIKAQIKSLYLEDNIDYIVYAQKGENLLGGRPSKEYAITIDTAKHIAMASRTEKGKEVRKYFIDIEKEYNKNNKQLQLPKTYLEALEKLVETEKEKQKALSKIEKDKPKVEFAEAVAVSVNSINIGTYTKILSKDYGVNIGQNRLFKWLRDNGYLIKNGRMKNEPTQKYKDLGYFEVKVGKVVTTKGIREVKTTLITGKGQLELANKIIANFK